MFPPAPHQDCRGETEDDRPCGGGTDGGQKLRKTAEHVCRPESDTDLPHGLSGTRGEDGDLGADRGTQGA